MTVQELYDNMKETGQEHYNIIVRNDQDSFTTPIHTYVGQLGKERVVVLLAEELKKMRFTLPN